MMLISSLLSRAKVALVVSVHAVGDGVEAARLAEIVHDLEELILAVEAALSVIAGVFRAVEFRGSDDFNGDSILIGESDRIGQLSAGEAGRIGDYGQHVVA